MADFRQGGTNRFGGGHGGHGGGFGGRGGRPAFGNKGGFRGDRGPVVMNKAVCDQCHQPCEVPFRPTAGKPVYCNACFGGKKEMGPRKDFNPNYKTPPRTDFGADVKKVSGEEIKKQIEVLNVKIDKLTKVIEDMTKVEKVEKEEKIKPKVVKAKKVSKKK